MDSESSSGEEPPSSSLDCTLLSAVTRLEAASCCAPVTSLMLAPAPATAGITMRMNTPLSACRRRALPARSLRPPASSAMASRNQMARPGPSSASDVTHCSLCMGYGEAAEAGTACKRRRESQEPTPPLSVSLKYTVVPAASTVLLSCTCSSGRPMEHASPDRSESASAGDAANMRASGMGIVMPNSTAAGSMTAALLLALGEAVAVPVADAPAVVLAVALSVSAAEPDAVVEGDPVGDRVRAGVRVSEVEGVPVCVGDAVPVALAVTDADGVWLPDGLSLPVLDGDTPADKLPGGVTAALAVPDVLPEAAALTVGAGEPVRLLLSVGFDVLVGELLGRADLEPVPVSEGVPAGVLVAEVVPDAVDGGVTDPEPVPVADSEGSTPRDSDAVAVELSLPVAVLDAVTLDVLLGGGDTVSVEVADGRGDLVREAVGSAVLEPLTLRVAEALPVPVALDEPVSVALDESVAVWLPVLEGVGGTKQIVTASTKSQDKIMLSTALMTRNWRE